MADSFIQLPPDSTGKLLDTTSLTVGANTVQRERINIADPAAAGQIAAVTSASALKVDNSAVTQPISAASLPLPSGAATDATLTGGNLVAIVKGGAKGSTVAAVLTSNPVDVNTQALHVDGSKVTQPVSGTVTGNQGTAAAIGGAWPVKLTDGTHTANVDPSGNLNMDLQQVSGSAVSTAATGVQKVGVTGNAGAAFDAAQNAAAPANEAVVGGTYNTTIPALTAGNASQLQVDSTGSLLVNTEGRKATYSAFATFTPVAGDIAVLPGSASKTIRVTRVEVSLSTTGAAALEQVQLIKRSAADTLGTSAVMTLVPHDSNFAAGSAAPLSYTAAPTLGTAVGPIRGVQFFDESATVAGSNTWLWTFGERGGASEIVLRGTAQQLAVNLGGVVATQTVTVSFEWTEE